MTFPFERTPKGGEESRRALSVGSAVDAPPRRRTAEIDENGALVFSMLTLETEDRS